MIDKITLTEVTDVITPDADSSPDNYNFSIETTYTETDFYSGGAGGREATFVVASTINTTGDLYSAISTATEFESFYCVNQTALPDSGAYVRSMAVIVGAGGSSGSGDISTAKLVSAYKRSSNGTWAYANDTLTTIGVNVDEEFKVYEIKSYTGA